MALSLPGLSYTITSSTAFICPLARWEQIVSILKDTCHSADFWCPEDLQKTLTVAQVRQLQHFASRSPVGKYKIAVLPLADQYRAETANALLKLLEEPPEFLYLLLLAETDYFLPTISSRVQRLSLAPDSATIHQDAAEWVAPWQSVFSTLQVENAEDRKVAQKLLYWQPLVHQTIKAETILEPFRLHS